MEKRIPIAVRAYAEPIGGFGWIGGNSDSEWSPPEYTLVFTTECRANRYQNLTIGSYFLLHYDKLKEQGIFYNEKELTKQEVKLLTRYADSNSDLVVRPIKNFVNSVFYPAIYELEGLCVGYNLPFSISRLAEKFGFAKYKDRGGFTFQLSGLAQNPDIVIKSMHRMSAFIRFHVSFSRRLGGSKYKEKSPKRYKGQFLDLRSLLFATRNERFTLEKACEQFHINDCPPQRPMKNLTADIIENTLKTTQSVYQLSKQLLVEYHNYNINKSPTRLYSPASIGKGILDMMGIKPFMVKNPQFPKSLLGYPMVSYYGGRSEVRYCKKPMRVNYIDFTSMYPTMCILQGLWRFFIADTIKPEIATLRTRSFLERATPETFQSKDAWKMLTTLVEIRAEDDILPVRAKYGSIYNFNTALNHLRIGQTETIWYTLADVAASKFLTGKTPHVIRAIKFVPMGIQTGLNAISIIGGGHINPQTDDLFKALVEHRHAIKDRMASVPNDTPEYAQLESLEKAVKVITNATTYGISIELNPEDRDSYVEVFGIERDSQIVPLDVIERPGRFFNPLVGTFISAAARLVLAICEALLARHGATFGFCDTDSIAVPPEHVKEIQDFFQPLSPYSFPDTLFKLDRENFNEKGELEPLWFYGISTKRYALYFVRDGKVVIQKGSLHGLGHLINPFTKPSHHKEWQDRLWEEILIRQADYDRYKELEPRYAYLHAISTMQIRNSFMIKAFNQQNRTVKDNYQKQIKPFSTVFVGNGTLTSPGGQIIKPISPYIVEDQKLLVHLPFTDFNSGKKYKGSHYWKTIQTELLEYASHEDTKFWGKIGQLERLHIIAAGIMCVGKESNFLEEGEVIGTEENFYQEYTRPFTEVGANPSADTFIQNLTLKDALVRGFKRSTFYRLKKYIKKGEYHRLNTRTKVKLARIMRSQFKQSQSNTPE